MISIIVAIAGNMAIGHNNQLLCHLSDDLRRFKALTSGHPVVMGRKTFESLPKRPLPNRRNIVLTTAATLQYPGIEVVHSVDEALALLPADEESFIMGGAAVYKQFLPYTGKLYVTWIHRDFDADTFFPAIDSSVFTKVSESEILTDPSNGIQFSYAEYCRR